MNRGCRLTGVMEGPIVEDLLGEGMLGPIKVKCRSRRRSSSVLHDSCMVLSMVLMVLTSHLMKLLDLAKWGNEVMWSM